MLTPKQQEHELNRMIAREQLEIQLNAVYHALRAEYYTGETIRCPIKGCSEARWRAMLAHARQMCDL